MGDDYMIAGGIGEFSGGAGAGLGFEPGAEEKLDEGEGEHYEEEYDAGKDDENGKGAAEIAVEGDVAKTEGGHDDEDPVKPGDPTVLLTFVGHDNMKEYAVDEDESEEGGDESQQHAQIALCLAVS